MELDKRIIDGKKPLDCFDIDKAEQFIGKKGYVTDFLQDFCNLNKVKISELKIVSHTELLCYFCGSTGKKYFLPVEWVKESEKKYRPFTGIEFAEKFNLKLNSIIHLRSVPTDDHGCYYYKVVFTGYRWDDNDVFEVFLNGWWVGLQDLLRRYEYEENGEWHKFGIEE